MKTTTIFKGGAAAALILGAGSVVFFDVHTPHSALVYEKGAARAQLAVGEPEEEAFVVTHLDTPPSVKAVYMTSWVAGTPSLRSRVVRLIEESELNALVIDIKDYSGKISFQADDPLIAGYGAIENRIPDIKEFIGELHDKGIYVIGRISVFQDPHIAALRPDLAVQSKKTKSPWRDFKGLSWVDPASREVWEYTAAIGKVSYEVGFDELNLDYIRFPSDGDMRDISYPAYNASTTRKSQQIEEFFSFISRTLRRETGAALSADLFGMTTTNRDDLNIGQVLERAALHFDYIAPMVYPSHYPPGFLGMQNPAAEPYRVVKYSLDRARERLRAATSTARLRPWLQDFDLGAEYTPEMVRAQIKATYDASVNSWMLWDPSNIYTKEALEPFYTEPGATPATTTREEASSALQ